MSNDRRYKVYRSRRKLGRGEDLSGLAELRAAREEERLVASGGRGRPGTGGRGPSRFGDEFGEEEFGRESRRGSSRRSRRHGGSLLGGGLRGGRPRWRRVLKFVVLGAVGWIALSLAIFLVSAQLEHGTVASKTAGALDSGGFPLTSANNILVLGSDARSSKSKEPGAAIGAPGRSDSMLLIRAGGGKSGRLSIPRDTIVDIPGRGRNKINAAYAFGGAKLAVTTVKGYLGIPIHHVIEVDFDNFPGFIDALGGVDYKGGCVVSKINGGYKNGGYTLRLKRGKSHLNGKQALALARTRKNDCNPKENDLTRARRQQKLVAAVKNRAYSPTTFLRLPWVAWTVPKTLKSDMSGPTLLGLVTALSTSSSPPTEILKPSGGAVLPDGGAGLVVSDQEKQRAVAQFLGK